MLVGEGSGYKMTCFWLVSDKTRGSSSEYRLFCCYTTLFFSRGKSVNCGGGFDPFPIYAGDLNNNDVRIRVLAHQNSF